MFKDIRYKLLVLRPEVKIMDISGVQLFPDGLFPNALVKSETMPGQETAYVVDGVDTHLLEYTGKFSKDGKRIWMADILELAEDYGAAKKGIYLVGWVPGSFMATHVHDPVSVPLFDEACISRMEHRGNQWENADVVQKYLEQFKDIELKAQDLSDGQPAA